MAPRTALRSLLVTSAALVALACGTEAPTGPEDTPSSPALALGTVRTTAANARDCPRGVVCRGIEVDCPGIPTARAFAGVASPVGTPRGVLLFTSGGSGMGFALEARSRGDLLEQLVDDGFEVVQVSWDVNWLESGPGIDAGTDRLGCRPATVVRWVHDTYFAPLRIPRSLNGRCGFCISGNSGGASQSSYPLSHYGLDAILDAVVPTGGPPHAALARSCLGPAGDPATFADDTRQFIDRGFGFFDGRGPCFRRDASFTSRWNQAAVSTGGSDYLHPQTRIHFVFGAEDGPMQAIAGDYVARLRSAGSPWVDSQVVPGTGHNTTGTEQGRAAVRAAILGTR